MKRALGVLAALLAVGVLVGCGTEDDAAGSGKAAVDAPYCGDGSLPELAVDCAVKKAKVQDAGAVRDGGRGRYVVSFEVSDNLSRGLIRQGLASDVFGMAEQIKKQWVGSAAPLTRVTFEGSADVIDAYGEESHEVVFRVAFSGKTIMRIQYDNIATDWDGLNRLADSGVFLLPDLRK